MWHLLAKGFLLKFQIHNCNLVAYYNDHMNEMANNVLIGIYIHKSYALWAHVHSIVINQLYISEKSMFRIKRC
jgi:hypothetical protein